jgi:hypothetical protein
MNVLTWIDLFRFLNERASDVRNFGKFDWSAPVIIHDAETGDEFNCDTMYITDNSNIERFVLMTNLDAVKAENINE